MDKPFCLLLIHGFGGSAKEMTLLARLLCEQGFDCRVVPLAGHSPEQKTIDNLPWREWVDSVRAVYRDLAPSHRVIAVGHSMGGLIAAVLGNERPFSGMAFINTPAYFWNIPQVVKNLRHDFRRYLRYYFVQSAGRCSFYTCLQFFKLLLHARPLFQKLTCPALILQARDDDSVWPKTSANYIKNHLGGESRLYMLPRGGHQVLEDERECPPIARRIGAFARKIEHAAPKPGGAAREGATSPTPPGR